MTIQYIPRYIFSNSVLELNIEVVLPKSHHLVLSSSWRCNYSSLTVQGSAQHTELSQLGLSQRQIDGKFLSLNPLCLLHLSSQTNGYSPLKILTVGWYNYCWFFYDEFLVLSVECQLSGIIVDILLSSTGIVHEVVGEGLV